jgi:hypothetical protein
MSIYNEVNSPKVKTLPLSDEDQARWERIQADCTRMMKEWLKWEAYAEEHRIKTAQEFKMYEMGS